MSLVNDMLRDLDQRRKQSDGFSATSSLTPVPEMIPEKARNSPVLFLLLVLVLGGAAVAWFWMQQENAPTTRSLDVNPAIVNQTPVTPASAEPISGSSTNPGSSAAELASQSQPVTPVAEAEEAPVQQGVSQAAPATLAAAEPATPDRRVAQQIPDRSITQQSPTALPTQSLAVSAADSAANQNEQVARGETPDVPAPTEEDVTPLQESARSNTVNLSAAPAEDVKSGAQLSPEERDVLAVQEALRLIASNNSAAAYAVLEKQVIDNRYAHQSRETYAKLLLNEGNLLGAMQLVDSGLALSANHAGFKKIKARLLIAQGKLNEAVALLITRAPEVSKDLEYHDILATAQLASRDYEGALISYTGLVQQDQGQGKWWYGFAASQDQLGNSNAARQGYSQAVRMPNLSANLRRRSQERLALLGQ